MTKPAALDLSNELDGVQGRQLRLRLLTLEPGGELGLHSHNGRPAVVYVVQGVVVEHRESSEVLERRPGESWAEGKSVNHWLENRGNQPVAFIVADIFKP